MQFTAQQIAALIKGELEGDPNAQVSQVAKIEEAEPGSLCFIANPKYEEYIYTSKASIIIVNEHLVLSEPINATLIRVKDAYSSFALLLEYYSEIISGGHKVGIEEPSFISPTAQIGKDVYIGAFTYIGAQAVIGDGVKIYPGCYIGTNVRIGNQSKIYAGVKIYDECKLGQQVVIHSGTVIGGDGFGFAPLKEGGYKKLAQIGNVVIEDDVEIGAGTTIDRGALDDTVIGAGVKIDNQVHIAHNVVVGAHTAIAAQTGIAGSTTIGAYCIIAGKASIVGHLKIADHTTIGGNTGVTKSIKKSGQTLFGFLAMDLNNFLRSYSIFKNLDDLQKRIQQLEKKG